MVIGFHKVAALASGIGGLGVAVRLQKRRRGLGGLLAGTLESIKLVIVNA